MDEPHLSRSARQLFALMKTIWHFGRKKGYVSFQPHQETLAKRLGVSLSTIKRALYELEGAGLIRRRRTRSGNRYYFLDVEPAKNEPSPQLKLSCGQSSNEPSAQLNLSCGIEEELKTVIEKQQQPKPAAADLFTPIENADAVLALESVGLSSGQARHFARKDPKLAIAVATFTVERAKDPRLEPLRCKMRFALKLLRHAEECGFERLPAGDWLAPKASAVPAPAPRRAEARVEAWQAAGEDLRAEARRRVEARGVTRENRLYRVECLNELLRMTTETGVAK